jgi:hypothetical protein
MGQLSRMRNLRQTTDGKKLGVEVKVSSADTLGNSKNPATMFGQIDIVQYRVWKDTLPVKNVGTRGIQRARAFGQE